MASLSIPAADKASIGAFKRDVIDASRDALVLVDFWAEWCGPCKTLTPLLEKLVAARAARVQLVKLDVDKHQAIATQFRIQSIPTVYAFIDGKPVDGFQGALGERELAAFIDRLLAALPAAGPDAAAEIVALVEAAQAALIDGAHAEAAEMFGALVQELPDRADIAGGYAKALLASGDVAGAAAALAAVPADSKDASVVEARAAVKLAQVATPVDDIGELSARLAAAPDDHAARFELASGLLAHGDRDGAAKELLDIMRRDASWNEGAAKARLLQLLEAAGFADPWAAGVRRKLSTVLFV